MAELAAGLDPSPEHGSSAHETKWSAAQLRGQYRAIVYLRWRMAINSLRRKGSAGELIARLVTYPLFAAFALGPTVGAGLLAWHFVADGDLGSLVFLLWGTFALAQLLNINLGQPGTTFDPTELIRFPLGVGNYIAIRLFFGLLSPGNLITTLMSLAIAIGIVVGRPPLWLPAFCSLALFAAVNVLFSRMVFAWVDRWLATRRAREVFTALIFTVSIGFQYLNANFSPAFNHRRHGTAAAPHAELAIRLYHRAEPFLAALPPGLTVHAIAAANARHSGLSAALLLATAAYGAVFLAAFALRTRTEFRGESLSDAATGVAKHAYKPVAAAASGRKSPATGRQFSFGLSPIVRSLLGRELLYVRRTSAIYGVLAPLLMVFLFAGRLANRGNSVWIFPLAMSYVLLGITPTGYNIFGSDGPGVQLYFFAPVRLRDVLWAKNLMGFLLAAAEILIVAVIVSYVSTLPPVLTVASSILWAIGTLLLGTTLGNWRSIAAPKKISLNKVANKQASPLSALLGMSLLLVSAAAGGALLWTARLFGFEWVLLPAFGLFAVTGLVVYHRNLSRLEGFAQNHREQLFSELCKP